MLFRSHTSKQEIEQHAQQQSLTWREDSSNAKDNYSRNYLRHQILPVVKERFQITNEQIIDHSERMQAQQSWLSYCLKKWIDENIHGISPDMEFYHDINCRLLLLREKYLWQLQRGPYGHRILDAIVSFCEEDGGATAKVCACQVEIAQHPRKFLSEFEFNPEDQIGWTYAWNYISWTATTKLTIREHEADPDQQVRSIACLRNRIDHRSPKTILVVVGIMNLIGFGLFSVLCIVSLLTIVIGFFALVMKLVGDKSEKMGIIAAISPVVLMVGGAALALFAWEKLKYYWNTKFIVPYVQRRFAYEYRNKWRIWVAHSMQVLTSPYQSYLGLVKHLCSNGNNLRNPSARLAEYLENDSGLALYSAAIPFAR